MTLVEGIPHAQKMGIFHQHTQKVLIVIAERQISNLGSNLDTLGFVQFYGGWARI